MQNEISKEYSAQQVADFESFISGLERLTADLPVLSSEDKNSFVKTPENASDWMNNMLIRSRQNLPHLPRSFDPDGVAQDLRLNEVISPFLLRLQRVSDRLHSAQFLARSDAFSALLSARRALKDAQVAGVDDDLSEGLRRFFTRGAKAAPTPALAATH